MRSHGRIDANQPAIVDALRKAGCFVQSLADVGKGCPDVLVSRAGMWFVLEVKVGRESLTPAEQRWHTECRAQVATVRSVEDALAAVGLREDT